MAETIQGNLSFQKVLDGLLRMHELSVAGERETDEVRKLRDAIDEPYSELSAEERDIIEGLSADLFDVENITSEPVLDYIPTADNAMASAIKAQHSAQYDLALKRLRESKSKPASRISFLRGRNWSEKGEFKVALLFFNHAARLDPGNDEYKVEALDALVRTQPEREQKETATGRKRGKKTEENGRKRGEENGRKRENGKRENGENGNGVNGQENGTKPENGENGKTENGTC